MIDDLTRRYDFGRLGKRADENADRIVVCVCIALLVLLVIGMHMGWW